MIRRSLLGPGKVYFILWIELSVNIIKYFIWKISSNDFLRSNIYLFRVPFPFIKLNSQVTTWKKLVVSGKRNVQTLALFSNDFLLSPKLLEHDKEISWPWEEQRGQYERQEACWICVVSKKNTMTSLTREWDFSKTEWYLLQFVWVNRQVISFLLLIPFSQRKCYLLWYKWN